MTMGLVGDHASYGAYTCTDHCAAWATDFGSNDCSADGSSCDELGFGVMVMVVIAGLSDGVFVGFLRDGREGNAKDCGGEDRCCKSFEFHVDPPAVEDIDRTSSPMAGRMGQMYRINIF
jgi:hypothetical protein